MSQAIKTVMLESRCNRDEASVGGWDKMVTIVWYDSEQMKEYYIYIMSNKRGTLYTPHLQILRPPIGMRELSGDSRMTNSGFT